MRRLQFIIQHDAKALTPLLPGIQSLADSEKDALGFLPAKAFEEAIWRQRLIAALIDDGGSQTFAGYLLHSGVYPNAKIQQIAAVPAFRKKGVASALMKALVSKLERVGFLSIRADVASDLPAGLAFYAKNGFERVRDRAGGIARGRTIIIHSRELETDSLFTPPAQSGPGIDLGIRHRGLGETPVFAFDLNVYFDLVRQRDQSDRARRLFGEALGHTIRLAVADEFLVELRRTSINSSADPILQMALQLPRLPKAESSELDSLAAAIHDIFFTKESPKNKCFNFFGLHRAFCGRRAAQPDSIVLGTLLSPTRKGSGLIRPRAMRGMLPMRRFRKRRRLSRGMARFSMLGEPSFRPLASTSRLSMRFWTCSRRLRFHRLQFLFVAMVSSRVQSNLQSYLPISRMRMFLTQGSPSSLQCTRQPGLFNALY